MPDRVVSLSYTKWTHRDVPWWGTGRSARENPVEGRWLTVEDAQKTFPWRVALKPGYQRLDNGSYRKVPDQYHVVLEHDMGHLNRDHQTVLGSVGKLYSPFQPAQLIDLAAEFVHDYDFGFDTAGDLCGHKIIFCALKAQGGTRAKGVTGEIDWWLILANNNAGYGSLRGDVAPIRPVCYNTLQFAQKNTQATWKLRHVGDMRERAKEASRVLGLITRYQQEFNDTADKLAEIGMELEQFETMLHQIMPTDARVGPRTRVANQEHHAGLISNFLHSDTIDNDWRFTRWGAINAVTEWAEWVRDPRKDPRTAAKDRRMLYTLFGGPIVKTRNDAYKALTRGMR